MQKFELTLSPDYVPDWTYVEAFRELFQNALDQEATDSSCAMDWEYDFTQHTLTVSTKNASLTPETLLLGSTSKAGDSNTIGQFGEGYKIATLVLIREGKLVTIYNNKLNEIWHPRFVKSRRFGTDILTFFIEAMSKKDRTDDNSLIFKVSNVSVDEYKQLCKYNLHMRNADGYKILMDTDYGEVLDRTDEDHGNLYVNGLFICNVPDLMYNYNLDPSCVALDRDRRVIDSFNAAWLTSKMWFHIVNSAVERDTLYKDEKDNCLRRAMKLIDDGTNTHEALDVKYLLDSTVCAPGYAATCTLWYKVAYEWFVRYNRVGSRPIPRDMDKSFVLDDSFTFVKVSSLMHTLITRCDSYEPPQLSSKEQTSDDRPTLESECERLNNKYWALFKVCDDPAALIHDAIDEALKAGMRLHTTTNLEGSDE